jgi:hypothetical protein
LHEGEPIAPSFLFPAAPVRSHAFDLRDEIFLRVPRVATPRGKSGEKGITQCEKADSYFCASFPRGTAEEERY